MAHRFLGHLGRDDGLKVEFRGHLSHGQEELEAESVAFIVSDRQGVQSRSHTYLSEFVGRHTTVDSLDFYQVMRAAGRVESLLGLCVTNPFEKFRTK